jgi:DNA-binding CsgD family transcriptional regulator
MVFIPVFALFLVAGMLGRSFEPPLPVPFNYFSSAAIILTYLSAALYSRYRGLPARRLLIAACVALGLYLLLRYTPVFVCQVFALPTWQLPVVLVAVTDLVYGFASASFKLLMFLYLLRYGLRLFCCLLPIACALCEGFYLISLLIAAPVAYWLKPLFLLVVLIAFPLLMAIKGTETAPDRGMKQAGGEMWDTGMAGSVPSSQSRGFSLFIDVQRLGLLAFGSIVFPLLYGLVAQICVLGNINTGLYDVWSEVVAIVAYALLAVSALLAQDRLKIESGFTPILALFATAFLILPVVWEDEIFLSGFMVKVGFLVYNTLVYLIIVRSAQREPRSCCLYFALAFALQLLAITGGRELGRLLFPVLDVETIGLISLIIIWLLAVFTLVLSFIVRRQRPVPVDDLSSSFERRCVLFAHRYALSNREFEVLLAFARGRSMKRIAETLSISNTTARTYIDRVYGKAGLRTKRELIAFIETLEEDGGEV